MELTCQVVSDRVKRDLRARRRTWGIGVVDEDQGKNLTTSSNDLLDQDYDQEQKEKEAFATEEVEQMDENLVAMGMDEEDMEEDMEEDKDLDEVLEKQFCPHPTVVVVGLVEEVEESDEKVELAMVDEDDGEISIEGLCRYCEMYLHSALICEFCECGPTASPQGPQ